MLVENVEMRWTSRSPYGTVVEDTALREDRLPLLASYLWRAPGQPN